MIKVNNIKCKIDEKINKDMIAKKIHCHSNDIFSYEIEREALDARHDDIYYNYNVIVNVKNENKYLKNKDVSIYEPIEITTIKANRQAKVAVVGFGPSGMFCALELAKSGLKPVIFERGSKVEKRIKDVENFWNNNILDTNSNVQFGEGGAGTFSDGKLTCRIKDKRVKVILDTFVTLGADPKKKYQNLPHIGTDKLRDIVKNIREYIIKLGGTFMFDTTVTDFKIINNKIVGLYTKDNYYDFDYVALCIGHSAYDTMQKLYAKNVFFEQKDYAVGVRVEHPQILINKNQNKQHYQKLPNASYRLTYHASNDRGVYSFCMCPGGIVVNSSAIANTIVTNGMSYSDRAMNNANSAILVQVKRSDYGSDHPLAGFEYQKRIEEKAYSISSSYKACVMNIKDYLTNKLDPLVLDTSFTNGYILHDIHDIFNDDINMALEEAFYDFDKKIPGFINQGIMIAAETRSSCPIRMTRNEQYESISISNLFPCGEGAGYAGGIVSSGVDGIRIANSIIEKINQ